MGAQRLVERRRSIPDVGVGLRRGEFVRGHRPARAIRWCRPGTVGAARGPVCGDVRPGGVPDRRGHLAGDWRDDESARRARRCHAVPTRAGGPGGGGLGHRLRGAQRRGGQGRRRAGGDGTDTNGAVGQDRHADRRPRSRRCCGDLTGRRSGLGAGVGSVGGAGIAACVGRHARERGTRPRSGAHRAHRGRRAARSRCGWHGRRAPGVGGGAHRHRRGRACALAGGRGASRTPRGVQRNGRDGRRRTGRDDPVHRRAAHRHLRRAASAAAFRRRPGGDGDRRPARGGGADRDVVGCRSGLRRSDSGREARRGSSRVVEAVRVSP